MFKHLKKAFKQWRIDVIEKKLAKHTNQRAAIKAQAKKLTEKYEAAKANLQEFK